MPPPGKPLLRPKLPKPKPEKLKTSPAAADARPAPSQWDEVPSNGGVHVLPQPFSSSTSCATFPLCPPPPSPPATVHLRSGRLPTPLIAVSASLLALSAVLLLALLVRWLVRRHRLGQQQEQHAAQDQEAPLAPDDDDDESVLGVDTTAWGGHGAEGDEEVDSGDVHHVWFIRTKGLDERAIAAIAAVVYDASSKGKSRNGGEDGGDGCAVCLAEFRDGETLRLLPRCGHAFHRVCIDTWLRAHVNCPLCRAPVQVHVTDKASATAAWVHSQTEVANHTPVSAARTEEDEAGRVVAAERAVRRAASMVTIPRRAWPDVQAPAAPASSSSACEEDMTGLAKIRRLLKLSDAFAGVGRSASFGAGTCQRLATTRSSDPSAAASTGGVSGGDEIELSR